MTKSTQLRITALVSEKRKRKAKRLAKALTNGNMSELLNRLIIEEHERLVAKKKSAPAATTRASNRSKLVGTKHVRSGKPARKGRASNAAANRSKRGALQNSTKSRLVSSGKRSGNATRSSTKSR
jgi:hypothetical protein